MENIYLNTSFININTHLLLKILKNIYFLQVKQDETYYSIKICITPSPNQLLAFENKGSARILRLSSQ